MHLSLSQITVLIRNIAVHRDEASYKTLFVFLFPPLKRFCFSLLKSNELAEEVAGDVMIALWQKEQHLLKIENVKTYAFIMAKNISIDVWRKTLRQKVVCLDDIPVEIYVDQASPEQILITDELRRGINSAIQSLPPRCRLVFQLIREDHLSYKEVGDILGISVKTVDAHLVTAMKKLTSAIKQEFNLA